MANCNVPSTKGVIGDPGPMYLPTGISRLTTVGDVKDFVMGERESAASCIDLPEIRKLLSKRSTVGVHGDSQETYGGVMSWLS